MHIGQWDLGLKMMSLHDVPVHVVMLSEDPVEVSRYTDEARAMPNLRVHQTGSSPLLAVELMAALKRGEFVAIQGDRPAGSQVMDVEFFGAPTSLPTGPAQLAMATGAPIIPIFVLFDREDRFRLEMMPPMRFAGVPREQRRAGDEGPVREAMRRLAVMMEGVVRQYPDQWFNFYDIWPARSGKIDV
jgi:KDO2-lipid IV(A) lauroyltransferase